LSIEISFRKATGRAIADADRSRGHRMMAGGVPRSDSVSIHDARKYRALEGSIK
jgi:hypothetical protein